MPLLLGLVAAAAAVVTVGSVLTRASPIAYGGDRPNFVVLDIDSLRYDHVGATRQHGSVTPTLDALAARGARFTHAYSQSGWTMPALVSHLTGALPVVIAAADGQVSWRPAHARDLPEILGLYGYTTAAFWGSTIPGTMSSAMGLTFGTVSMHPNAELLAQPPTHEVVDFLKGAPKEPFFAYVHDIDLHHPLSYRTRDGRVPFDRASTPTDLPNYQRIHAAVAATAGEEAARDAVLARYDGVLHLYDNAVGRILAALDNAGLAERTVVVVTSDHGEDFYEHALAEHGLLYDTTLHVPLIVYDPVATPVTIDTIVQSVDLAPTLLARAGIPVDATMDGHSLLPLLGGPGEPYPERAVFSLSEACHVSLRTRTHKLVLRDLRPQEGRMWHAVGGANGVVVTLAAFAAAHPLDDAPLADCSAMKRPADGGTTAQVGPSPDELAIELYDLVADPGEHTNLVAAQPDKAAEMLVPLLTTLADRRAALVDAPREVMTPAQIQALKDNGYWGLVHPGAAAGEAAPVPPGTAPAAR